MNPWPYVTAAYAATLAGGGVLAWLSFRAMRRAERAVDRDRR